MWKNFVKNFIKHDEGNIAAMVTKEVNHVENKCGWYIDTGATAHACAEVSSILTRLLRGGSSTWGTKSHPKLSALEMWSSR